MQSIGAAGAGRRNSAKDLPACPLPGRSPKDPPIFPSIRLRGHRGLRETDVQAVQQDRDPAVIVAPIDFRD